MRLTFDPFRLLLICLAGWLNQQQQDAIDYLQEENRDRILLKPQADRVLAKDTLDRVSRAHWQSVGS